MRSPRRGRRPQNFVPRVEGLEDRRVPAVTVTTGGTGELVIRGGAENDRVLIFDNGTGTVNNVVVFANGREFMPGIAVTGINIKTRGGNDSVTYTLNGPLLTGQTRIVIADLGPGNNAFAARLKAALANRSTLSFQVTGGSGADNMSLSALNDINIGTGSLLNVQFMGGDGPDLEQVNYRGTNSATLNIFEDGGPGDDTLNANVTLSVGSSGAAAAQLLGDAGNDTFTFMAAKVSLLDRGAITGLVDGGQGLNRAFITPGIGTTRTHNTFI